MEILWDYRVVLDLFLGGVGIGTFLFGALLFYLDPQKYAGVIKRAWIVAPFLVILGLLILVTELGRPMNIFKTLINVNPTSIMSIGIYIQGICILLMLLVLVRTLSTQIELIAKPLVYVASIFAGLVGTYHGFLLTGIELPAWNNAVPVIFFLSSLVAGSSLALLLCFKSEACSAVIDNFKLPIAFNVILTIELVAVLAWAYALMIGGMAAQTSFHVLMSSFGTEFWMLAILIGILVPLGLFTLSLMQKVETKAVFLPAVLCMIAGSFFLKHLFVYLGQAV